jgi:hypothetical protein
LDELPRSKIYAGETSIWAAGVRGGRRMRRGGEGSGQARQGAEARRWRGGWWWAARGFRTWAERPNAGPHVGEKTKQNMSPVFQEKKTKDLRFRVFFLALPASEG